MNRPGEIAGKLEVSCQFGADTLRVRGVELFFGATQHSMQARAAPCRYPPVERVTAQSMQERVSGRLRTIGEADSSSSFQDDMSPAQRLAERFDLGRVPSECGRDFRNRKGLPAGCSRVEHFPLALGQ